jgi:hypothetical protein
VLFPAPPCPIILIRVKIETGHGRVQGRTHSITTSVLKRFGGFGFNPFYNEGWRAAFGRASVEEGFEMTRGEYEGRIFGVKVRSGRSCMQKLKRLCLPFEVPVSRSYSLFASRSRGEALALCRAWW